MNFKLTNSPSAIIGLVVVVLLGLVYFFFFSGPSAPPLSATSVAGSQAEQNFAALVTRLSPITFDLRLLSDARFASLTDLTTPIAPEAVGRTDPFASFTGNVSVTTGTKKAGP